MEYYIFILIVLFITSIVAFIVGVSNDAVNFLNSAIGSRAANRKVILSIASFGVLIGTIFSSGMMEVARKGIFNPEYFVLHDVMIIFLAAMLTNIMLLDLFNTFGLPTSTTVSIVFAILGGAIAVGILKITLNSESISNLLSFINTKNVIIIISGIGLSIIFAFIFGLSIQFITRLIFTFDFEKTFKRYGAIYCGLGVTLISFFIFVNGATGSSVISPNAAEWILCHLKEIFIISLIAWTSFLQLCIFFTKLNILKIIVLFGTFALAFSFSANDMVNFIGAPLGALGALKIGMQSGTDPMSLTMEALKNPIKANSIILLLSGLIMMITLWKSRKARTVTKTEISLGRQYEGVERFESSNLARGIVRMFLTFNEGLRSILPSSFFKKIAIRIDPDNVKMKPLKEGEIPSFDLMRASVNLIVASSLIIFGTSLKLPLSTTFVTFMVAMSTSLADKAWGRESAVYRVNGVLTVIGGWFFTAFMAFSISLIFAFIIYYVKLPGILILVILSFYFFFKSAKVHRKREDGFTRREQKQSNSISEKESRLGIISDLSHLFEGISNSIDRCLDGICTGKRKVLKDMNEQAKHISIDIDIIIGNILLLMKSTHKDEKKMAPLLAKQIGSLQVISSNFNSLVKEFYHYIDNHHKIPNDAQIKELNDINVHFKEIIKYSVQVLSKKDFSKVSEISRSLKKLKRLVIKYDLTQMKRLKSGATKSRSSLLFVSTLVQIERIADQVLNILMLNREAYKKTNKS